jgi:hypothetical protein
MSKLVRSCFQPQTAAVHTPGQDQTIKVASCDQVAKLLNRERSPLVVGGQAPTGQGWALRLSAERPHAAGTRGMWLRGPQPRHVNGELHVVPTAAAGFLPGPRVKLLAHRVIRFPLNHLAWG